MFTIADRIWSRQSISEISESIDRAESIAICGHRNPDGDSLGSLLSLGLGLKKLGKRVYMLCSEEIPPRYRDLPGIEFIQNSLYGVVDLAIAVDCGSYGMLDDLGGVFDRATEVIEIDHHSNRNSFADISLIDERASSAGELVYFVLDELGVEIDKQIAQNILTSVIVETNSFRLPELRSQTFEICADLLCTGIDFSKITESVYWVNCRETEILGGLCLARCRFLQDGALAISSLRRRDFFKAGAKESHGDPVIEKIRSIHGVKLAVLFRQNKDGDLRVSFRSKDGLDVSALAKQFGGGGHTSAAGCRIRDSRGNRQKIIKASAKFLNNYKEVKREEWARKLVPVNFRKADPKESSRVSKDGQSQIPQLNERDFYEMFS
ncbi:phosphoesterase [Chitinispirillum alkaliphilum]|nr:phosphoesterase [Chitinispirillum alkaliphilum]